MKCPEDWCDVVIFLHTHQDPGSTILNVLEPLEAPARDLDKECFAEDKCIDGIDAYLQKLLCQYNRPWVAVVVSESSSVTLDTGDITSPVI